MAYIHHLAVYFNRTTHMQLCIKRSAINGRCEVYSTDKSALSVTPLETEKKGPFPALTKKVSPSIEEPESELITKLKKR
jgi:hypothetical protein